MPLEDTWSHKLYLSYKWTI